MTPKKHTEWWKPVLFIGLSFACGCLIVLIAYFIGGHPPLYVTLSLPTKVESLQSYWLFDLGVIMCAGGFGGCLGALSSVDISLLMQGRTQSIGDRDKVISAILLGGVGGIGGAVAILPVLIADGKLLRPPTDEQVLGLIAISVIAGFLGFTLLKTMARGLSAELEKRFKDTENLMLKKVGAAEAESRQLSELNSALIDGLQTANRKEAVSPADMRAALERLDGALQHFPTNRSAGIVSARLLRYLRKLPEAIERLTTVLKSRADARIVPDHDTAALLYNRACYQTLAAQDKQGEEAEVLLRAAEEDLLADGKLVTDDLLSASKDEDLAGLIARPRVRNAIEAAQKKSTAA